MTETKGLKRTREIKGVLYISLALFLFLCLFSYSPQDPSFTHFVAEKGGVHNLIGPFGSYTADSLIRLLGASVLLLPIFLCVAGFRYLVDNAFRIRALHLLGFTGLCLSLAALLAMIMADISLSGSEIRPGGVLGLHLFQIMDVRLNTAGTFLVLISILLISLMVMTSFSVVITARLLSRITALSWFTGQAFWEKWRGRMRRSNRDDTPEAGHTPRIVPSVGHPEPAPTAKEEKKVEQMPFDFVLKRGTFRLPPLSLLSDMPHKDTRVRKETLIANSRILEKKLGDFGVEGRVVEVRTGPVITMYELEPASGVKIAKITTLSDDLALALRAPSVRIVAPIPGKAVVGIEIPNPEREAVYLKDVLENTACTEGSYRLPIALGKDIVGAPVVADLVKMPHLLIAGTTGSGKSVSLNAMICSILFKVPPDEAKFLMIDPKRLELAAYEGIPHLLHPVVVDPKKASQVLKWAVQEMERRYQAISTVGAKSIDMFNKILDKRAGENINSEKGGQDNDAPSGFEETGPDGEDEETLLPIATASAGELPLQKLPYIIIVIDELADLMMVAQRNVEESLARLAQMARAAGIHLILATQRPSVDVITGLIKANFRTRISFQVSSKVDSRTILDDHGAEKLLGAGDMLFIPPGSSRLNRIHGAFVSDKEISRVVDYVKKQAKPVYDESITTELPDDEARDRGDEAFDKKYDEAVELVTDLGQASISLVQRYLKIGYNRAARIIEQMEAEGVVGPSDGVKPRKVLARKITK